MDEFLFEPHIRGKIKQAIVGVFLQDGHEHDMAADAGEMFLRLIETGLTRIEHDEKASESRGKFES